MILVLTGPPVLRTVRVVRAEVWYISEANAIIIPSLDRQQDYSPSPDAAVGAAKSVPQVLHDDQEEG